GEGLAEVLAGLWAGHAAALRATGADVVVPVPLHWRRRLTRGYNQSEALARVLAAHLGLPCRARWLRRVRATPPPTQQTSPSLRPSGRRNPGRAAWAILMGNPRKCRRGPRRDEGGKRRSGNEVVASPARRRAAGGGLSRPPGNDRARSRGNRTM